MSEIDVPLISASTPFRLSDRQILRDPQLHSLYTTVDTIVSSGSPERIGYMFLTLFMASESRIQFAKGKEDELVKFWIDGDEFCVHLSDPVPRGDEQVDGGWREGKHERSITNLDGTSNEENNGITNFPVNGISSKSGPVPNSPPSHIYIVDRASTTNISSTQPSTLAAIASKSIPSTVTVLPHLDVKLKDYAVTSNYTLAECPMSLEDMGMALVRYLLDLPEFNRMFLADLKNSQTVRRQWPDIDKNRAAQEWMGVVALKRVVPSSHDTSKYWPYYLKATDFEFLPLNKSVALVKELNMTIQNGRLQQHGETSICRVLSHIMVADKWWQQLCKMFNLTPMAGRGALFSRTYTLESQACLLLFAAGQYLQTRPDGQPHFSELIKDFQGLEVRGSREVHKYVAEYEDDKIAVEEERRRLVGEGVGERKRKGRPRKDSIVATQKRSRTSATPPGNMEEDLTLRMDTDELEESDDDDRGSRGNESELSDEMRLRMEQLGYT